MHRRYPGAVSSWLLIPSVLAYALSLVAMVMKVFALIDAVARRGDAYPATSNQTKVFWVAILAAALLVSVVFAANPLSLLNVAATAVAGVYLADVRPALRDVVNQSRY